MIGASCSAIPRPSPRCSIGSYITPTCSSADRGAGAPRSIPTCARRTARSKTSPVSAVAAMSVLRCPRIVDFDLSAEGPSWAQARDRRIVEILRNRAVLDPADRLVHHRTRNEKPFARSDRVSEAVVDLNIQLHGLRPGEGFPPRDYSSVSGSPASALRTALMSMT